jgi:type I restriction-modification system DNA methylase subunit
MALFNEKTLHSALRDFASNGASAEQIKAAKAWASRAQADDFDLQNESQLEQEFNRIVLQEVLGYSARAPGAVGTMQVKQTVPGGTIVDVALGRFSSDEITITAPLELKGPKVALDRIMPGRAKTPVQQAWDYAMDVPGARWVLVSNMKELRLYAFGQGRQNYESLDLRKIDVPEELAKLRLIFSADSLLSGATKALLDRSASANKDVTEDLYRDYKELRGNLMSFVADQHSSVSVEDRIRVVQTLLDRVLFVAFAEDKNLLPRNMLSAAIEQQDKFFPRPKWEQLVKLFEWIDKGAPPHNIPKYNGGLFRHDPIIDVLALPDHLVEQFIKIADYDFASEISVTILGHIFEQSITDIENDKAEAGIEAPPPATKKKREGVVYTPDFITRFIVEQTIRRHLTEIEDKLLPKFGRREADGSVAWRNKTSAEADFWNAYLSQIATLRILDPACGSGAFLIAAFNFLNAEQKRVRDRLSELQPGILTHLSPNADVGIITNNLFGVDVNAESVEITKLALWLQTARRERALESLDGNIMHGNSLVSDEKYHSRPFDWQRLGGDASFDIVLGNPPYVRMELVKPIKPHLEERFSVATDRADLYAYFFELGVKLLKPGGRLGYISSSTFFRTGSGKLLRAFLAEHSIVESVIDFGDLQVFDGVTTYPAIVTLRKDDRASDATLRYLNVRVLPDDLGKTFDEEAREMPRERLSSSTWRFESNMLDAIREKIKAGRRTLEEIYGAPLYGVKTGLNKAFILSREDRDRIVERAGNTPNDRSAELLKPFLVGENLKRWHVESDDLWLVYTPKNRIDIDDYPALRDHLAPFRERLEKRAGPQEWWELQQAQANYEPAFSGGKVIYSDIANNGTFSVDRSGIFLANTAYFIPSDNDGLASYLNSRLAWFYFAGLTNIARGGYLRLRTDFIGQLPALSNIELSVIQPYGMTASATSQMIWQLSLQVQHRISDLSHRGVAITDWSTMSFKDLQSCLSKRFKITIPVGERDEWEQWFEGKRAEAGRLRDELANSEAEIDAEVYRMFELTKTEIAAIEDAIAAVSPSLGVNSYAAISAVEGLELTPEARQRLARRAGEHIDT